MALQTLVPEVSRPFDFRWFRVGIMARSAPQSIAARDFATALRQLFNVAGDIHVVNAGPDKCRNVISQQKRRVGNRLAECLLCLFERHPRHGIRRRRCPDAPKTASAD